MGQMGCRAKNSSPTMVGERGVPERGGTIGQGSCDKLALAAKAALRLKPLGRMHNLVCVYVSFGPW